MRKEYKELLTVADFREYLADLPDDMRVCRQQRDYYGDIVNDGVSAIVGAMRLGRHAKEEIVLWIRT